jgi:hypothetical protein
MQFFMKCLALLPLLTVAVSGASKFADTCQNIEGRGTQIRADCRENEHGQYRTSTLDLNRCLKNGKGDLKCGKKWVQNEGNWACKKLIWEQVVTLPPLVSTVVFEGTLSWNACAAMLRRVTHTLRPTLIWVSLFLCNMSYHDSLADYQKTNASATTMASLAARSQYNLRDWNTKENKAHLEAGKRWGNDS